MLSALFELDILQTAVSQKALILTPNSRLNRKIVDVYNQLQLENGSTHWHPITCYSLQQWIQNCLQDLWVRGYQPLDKHLLSDQQALWIWQQIIKQDLDAVPLMDITQTAQTAHQALKSLLLWDIDSEQLAEHNAGEHNLFIGWKEAFLTTLSDRQLILQEQAIPILKQAFSEGTLNKWNNIYLQSFDDIAPAYKALIDMAGSHIHKPKQASVKNNNLSRLEFVQTEDELRAAAHWSRQILEQNPNSSIGVITPNLGQNRELVERIFTEVFEFNYLHPETPRYTLPFNFSTGTPLAQTPVIKNALNLLRLEQVRHTVSSIQELFFSPFSIFDQLSHDTKVTWLKGIRSIRTSTILSADLRRTLSEIAENLSEKELLQLTEVQSLLQYLREYKKQRPKLQSAQEWTNSFSEQLTKLGWPGQRRLDSVEYQQVNQWFLLLDQFQQLDSVSGPVSRQAAFNHLSNMASATHFQAQTPESPIQILGILEGAGLRFDHCWVFGLTDRSWPVSPSPNPLLPQSLQKLHAMPHSTAERELTYARSLMENYRQAATTVIFSSSNYGDDEVMSASPLIRDLNIDKNLDNQINIFLGQSDFTKRQFNPNSLDWFNPGKAPQIDPDEAAQMKGGTTILQWQSACPYNAFARFRLGAEPKQTAEDGFPALQRGVIIHQILANFWQEVQTSTALHKLNKGSLESLLEHYSNQAFDSLASLHRLRLGDELIELEKNRQLTLLKDWLELEKQRPEFTVIGAEHPVTLKLNALALRMRIDRIDKLEDGRLLLIDYKTGTPTFNKFMGPRLEEPQLPLYGMSLFSDDNTHNKLDYASITVDDIAGLGYAIINVKALGFSGLANGDLGIAGIQAIEKQKSNNVAENWQAQWHSWSESLNAITQEFIEGEAPPIYAQTQLQRHYEEFIELNRLPEQAQIKQILEKKRQSSADDSGAKS